MLSFGNKEFRNLQEQVGKNQEDIKKIKEGLGSALPDPIAGPQGPQGPQGERGPQGRTPIISIGTGPLPQSGYQFRDIYIASQTGNGVVKGNVYQMNDIGRWVLQLNIVGPQGLPGQDIDEVIANPDGEAIEDIEKISIDGIIYTIRAEDTYTKEEIDSILETIKKNVFTLVDITEYPTLADFLATTGEDGIIYLYPIDTSDLTKGYHQYIYESNEWIDMGSTDIDLNNYPTKSGDETITGNWTFSNRLRVGTFSIVQELYGQYSFRRSGDILLMLDGSQVWAPVDNARDFGRYNYRFRKMFTTKIYNNNNNYGLLVPDTTSWTSDKEIATTEQIPTNYVTLDTEQTITKNKTIKGALYFETTQTGQGTGKLQILNDNGYSAKIKFGNFDNLSFSSEQVTSALNFNPTTNNSKDLGLSNKRWKDLYLAGNISDGTNSVTVAQLANLNGMIVSSGNLATTAFGTYRGTGDVRTQTFTAATTTAPYVYQAAGKQYDVTLKYMPTGGLAANTAIRIVKADLLTALGITGTVSSYFITGNGMRYSAYAGPSSVSVFEDNDYLYAIEDGEVSTEGITINIKILLA